MSQSWFIRGFASLPLVPTTFLVDKNKVRRLSPLSLSLSFSVNAVAQSQNDPLMHGCFTPYSQKDILHSSKRYFTQFISLLNPPPSPDPVNRSPSLHLGRQLSPARFLVDSCDAAAHVRQEFCPGWRHLCCDGLCESLSEDLQDDTAEDLHETQNNPVAWMVPGQPPPFFF